MLSICSSMVKKRSYLYQKFTENRYVTLDLEGYSMVLDGYIHKYRGRTVRKRF